jgi:NADPH:quinone reductase
VPGTDAAGIVISVGEKVERVRPGDRVACGNWYGGFAERMTATSARTSHLPPSVDFLAGSIVRHAYLTAWYVLVNRAQLKPGETILVTGAAGGVGLACVEMARFLGARVIGAVGSAAKAAVVKSYGADEVVDYSREEVRDRVRELTGGEGVDVCVDNVGGALFATLARIMRWNGRLVPLGFASGEIPSVPMNLPLLKNYAIVGAYTGAWGDRSPEEMVAASDEVMTWIGEGKLRPHIDRVLPLERAAEAMCAIADRSVQGRIVLQVR